MRNEREAMPREAVVVALDSKRRKGSVEIVEWAFKYLVRPGDILLVLGVLDDDQLGHPKKQSCFPFNFLFATGACERSEMVDDDDLDSVVIKEKYEKMRGEYEIGLQTINRLCQSNEVQLQVKFAVGYCPARLAIEQARDLNTRWILMDSHFRESRLYLRGHVSCNIAVMKNKYFATLMLSNATPTHSNLSENIPEESYNAQHPVEVPSKSLSPDELRMSPAPAPYRQNPCCYPVSWRTGFPRVFSHSEVEVITNGFADDYVTKELTGVKVYQGILQDTTVIVKCYKEVNKGFWSLLKILSRVYHRNILNLVGYCYTGATAYMVFDFPCLGNLEVNFQIEELANKLGWRTRWCIAQEIGRSLRYLHEECADGPIIYKSVCSCNVTLSHDNSAMLANLRDAEWLDGVVPCDEDLVAKCSDSEEDERLFVDVRGYGKFLLELITGKNACSFPIQGNDQSLIDWAFPQLENGVLKELMDCRVIETAGDARMVRQMAHAALRCLNVDADHKLSMSEALAIVRGDELVVSIEALKIYE
ncbi:protein NSP-INTERACTING KINASE 2-like [Argentina anserina]|uniref:protein NSP-INTERACTING KINASE 2-like n=1 Tax=Argentina anserina TaxID=57926 RepID=UPI0021767234|nr:protein NSP-INTERACTING KINASE 2-like [Potentilla anserina]